ncbi:MAG: hypothetical protein K9G58_08080 [Bacteroidales bacterium]|nr:hypothetical protein [Bacteroidales bacterium]MCF8398108.1 hypothetical protein [Bacteroidales bacterium]
MKSLKFIVLFMIAIGLSLSACKKKDEETEPQDNNEGSGTMTAKIDGTDWSASLAVQGVYSNNLFTVTGSDANSKQLQITIMNVNDTGDYTLGGDPTNTNAGRWTEGIGQEQTFSTQLGLGSGMVNITEWTGSKAEGTFSFTAKNSEQAEVSITEGAFSVSL